MSGRATDMHGNAAQRFRQVPRHEEESDGSDGSDVAAQERKLRNHMEDQNRRCDGPSVGTTGTDAEPEL